jgi:hypothetical protein
MQGVTSSAYMANWNGWILAAAIVLMAIGGILVWYQMRTPHTYSSAEPGEDDAHRDLRFRYEHHEIDLDEYMRLRTQLDRRR